jgi:hypothetical protein
MVTILFLPMLTAQRWITNVKVTMQPPANYSLGCAFLIFLLIQIQRFRCSTETLRFQPIKPTQPMYGTAIIQGFGISKIVNDASLNGLNGTNNGTTDIAGQIGRGKKLCGSSSIYIALPDNNPVGSNIDQFVFSAWIQIQTHFMQLLLIVPKSLDYLYGIWWTCITSPRIIQFPLTIGIIS